MAQTPGNGAWADNSAILGGKDHHIDSTAVNSVILGGENITAAQANTVYMIMLNLQNIPVYDDEASAIAAGLELGTVYRTSSGELRIRYVD